ncbi:MAG: response regulator transcription factor [Nitrospiria bacterium]
MDEQSVPILLAEDSPSDAAIIQRSLTKGNVPNPLHLARDGQEALDRLRDGAACYGVLILDIHLPKVGGIDVLKEANRVDPEIVVIMLTANASFQTAVQSLRHEGAFDYLEKSKDDLPQLVDAVRLALKKWDLRCQTRWVVPTSAGDHRVIDMAAGKERFDLSNREIDVVKYLCRGDTNKEIGEQLFISDLTVKGHLKHIYEKMGVHTRSAVVSTILASLVPSTEAPPTLRR